LILTEQIQLKKTPELSHLCHLTKDLYNLANFYVRQELFNLGNWLNYYDLDYLLKHKEAYRKLPSGTAQETLRILDKNWKSFFRAIKDYKKHPKKYKGRPRPPKYKEKNGEFIAAFTYVQCKIRDGYLRFPKKTNLPLIKTRITNKLKQVRIIPKGEYYLLEIVYEKEVEDLGLDKNRIMAIDLGLNNIVTCVNNIGLQPFIIRGNVIKSINHFYNKQLARYKSIKDKQKITFETKRLQKLHKIRNNKIKDLFHKISRKIINYCINNNIGTIIIGYNKGWKQKINLGKRNNQNFVQIPLLQLVEKIKYKAEMVGIQVSQIEEKYTSKCSFLDNEPIEKRETYLGKRINRGLFKSSNGILINADVNGAYNIMKKVVPKALEVDGIKDVGLHPHVMKIGMESIESTYVWNHQRKTILIKPTYVGIT